MAEDKPVVQAPWVLGPVGLRAEATTFQARPEHVLDDTMPLPLGRGHNEPGQALGVSQPPPGCLIVIVQDESSVWIRRLRHLVPAPLLRHVSGGFRSRIEVEDDRVRAGHHSEPSQWNAGPKDCGIAWPPTFSWPLTSGSPLCEGGKWRLRDHLAQENFSRWGAGRVAAEQRALLSDQTSHRRLVRYPLTEW